MAYTAKTIANEFLELAKNEDKKLTQMQIQKLVYICHGYSLAVFDKPLISDEIQAWQYGPIIPELYQEFKVFGKSPINILAKNFEINDNFEIIQKIPRVELNDSRTKELIQAVWDKYKGYSGPNLSDLTHRDNTPWAKTYVPGFSNLLIDNEIIKEHYKNLIEV